MEYLQYPIGRFNIDSFSSESNRQHLIFSIGQLPEKLRTELTSLNDRQINTPYRSNGWTVRQVVHHITSLKKRMGW